MRIMFVHAHFDDYEFTAAGTFEMWRRRLGDKLCARVVICTDGCAGHHARTRVATGRLREREQRASARLGKYEFAALRYPNGRRPREACLLVDTPLLAALWKAIRDFEPDYLFCPPLPLDPLTGIHVDHVAVAEAVRKVAYMINVPHAFTPEYPADERRSMPCKVPVILNVHDHYGAGAGGFDLAVDTEEAFALVCRMSWCHQSQVREWLPWVGRHRMEPPETLEAWHDTLRKRCLRQQRELGLRRKTIVEIFTVTAWGEVPTVEQLERDVPNLVPSSARRQRLAAKLRAWRGEVEEA